LSLSAGVSVMFYTQNRTSLLPSQLNSEEVFCGHGT
jgi:hypothetical protein